MPSARLIVAMTMIGFAPIAQADTSLDGGVQARALLDRWLQAQNDGDFALYQSLYATPFVGVRRSGTRKVELDRAGWLKDRARMFKKKMTVTADEIDVRTAGAVTTLRFRQTWRSASWGDVGHKELQVVSEAGAPRIAREEQLDSRPLLPEGPSFLLAAPDVTAEGAQANAAPLVAVGAALHFIHAPHGYPRTVDAAVLPSLGAGHFAVALGVCGEEELSAALGFYSALDARVKARPAPAEAMACPKLARDPDTQTGWSWPGESQSTKVAGGTLEIFVFDRNESEAGDFARSYRQSAFLILYRDRVGKLIDMSTIISPTDYAELQGIDEIKGGFALRETDVDAPCNGANRHAWKKYTHLVRVSVVAGKIDAHAVSDKTIERGRCSDDEAKLYR